MHMVEGRRRREFSLGRSQVPGPGCPVASCRSRSPAAFGPSRAARRCVRCVRLSRGVGRGPSPRAASEQLERYPMLSPPFPSPPAPRCCLSALLNPPSIHTQVLAPVCPFRTGWGSRTPMLRAVSAAREASSHLHNPHKNEHLGMVLGLLLVLEQK